MTRSVRGGKKNALPKRHAELVSASFKRAVFTFNPKNNGLDYYIHGYLDPETSSGQQENTLVYFKHLLLYAIVHFSLFLSNSPYGKNLKRTPRVFPIPKASKFAKGLWASLQSSVGLSVKNSTF